MSEFDTNDGLNLDATEAGQDLVPEASGPKHARSLDDVLPQVTEPLPSSDDADVVMATLEDEVTPPLEALPSQPPVSPEPSPKKRKKWPTVLLALLVLALGAYLAGVLAFMHLFMPNTTLNGEDVSLRTTGEVAASASTPDQPYTLDVTGQGIGLKLTEESIKVRYDGKAFARAAIKEQHPWLWPLELATTHDIELERAMSYDAMLLDDLIASAVDTANKDATDPVDASFTYDEAAKHYVVKPEVAGTRLDKAAVTNEVHTAIKEQLASLELPASVLVQPAVTSTDEALVAGVEKANGCLEASQELVTKGEVVATVGADDLHKWVKLDDKLEVSFDDEACTKWARGDLSNRLDTVGSSRSFQTPDGRTISVSGGIYGWSINGADIAKKISENVMAGKKDQIEITWLMEAETWNPGGNEWGDSYVEIDLTAQYVRYFQDGKLALETPCVTGGLDVNGKNRETPTGVYYINSNMESGNVELRGEIDPKTHEPEYISYVKYWMPFIDNGFALHDADWRSSFGGDIYVTAGSHGCVNLPPEKAKQLYGMVHVGTVVVVHK